MQFVCTVLLEWIYVVPISHAHATSGVFISCLHGTRAVAGPLTFSGIVTVKLNSVSHTFVVA